MPSQQSVKIGVVGIPGKWSTEVLADEIEARTGYRLVIDMHRVDLDLNQGRLWYGDTDLCALDGLMVKKISPEYSAAVLDRLELLRIPEAAGVRIFSRPERILRLVDRLACTVSMANTGVPMPLTRVTEDLDTALTTVEEFGSAIFKPLYSTKARGMELIHHAEPDWRDSVKAFQKRNPMMYIQRRLDLDGRDMALMFLGGEYLGSYARVAHGGSWNTTVHSGGKYEACDPGAEIIEIARRAQAPFGLDFTTVDVAESSEGPVVFEVSAFGGFKGAREGLGMNVASLYATHALQEIALAKGGT
ncbi:MAG: GAK system ATP-grasp enzyme [Gammaproteobacteria bacterium]